MFADTASRTGFLASLVGTVRRSMTSAVVLRGLIILSFSLYELPYLRRLTTGEPWLALPLFDVGLVDDPRTFVVLEVVYIGSSLLACFPRFVVPGCFVAGTASILLVSFDLTYRLQFAFLPGGALLAFALSEIVSRTKDPDRRVDLPFVLLLGSIYGFASFHKLLNFTWMKVLLPSSVFSAPGGPVPALYASADNWLLDLVAWTVVPYEALLAVLTLSRRCLKPRLVCVGLFHWLLIFLVPFIWHVALFMLSLHLYLAALQRPAIRRRMFVDRNWIFFVAVEGAFVAGKMLGSSISGPAGVIVTDAAFASLVLFPVFFLDGPFLRSESKAVDASGGELRGFGLRTFGGRLRGIRGASVIAFGALVLAFGCSPFLLQKQYSVLSLGWSMFAGGEYRDGTYFTLKTPASACFRFPGVNNMIWSQGNERQITYLAFRRADLERLKRFLERRNCGGPPLSIESAKF